MASISCHPLPRWSPADLAAALDPGPVAVLSGIMWERRRCTLVAWAPVRSFATVDAAAEDVTAPPDGPAPLTAAVGTIAWDGTARFWTPGAAALFDPTAGTLWVMGGLPTVSAGLAAAPHPTTLVAAQPLWDYEGYGAAVEAARQAMRDGALAKVILSVPFMAPCGETPAVIYQRLCAGEPPGLAFSLQYGPGDALVGASPEPLVLREGKRVEMHLLAGTRPAGAGLEAELLTSPKERLEHLVAVEQALRDLRSVCVPESVSTEALLSIERHPGLIHLASHLAGTLQDGLSSGTVVDACFPAGTVGGVPRAAAMAFINQAEPMARDWYAGAVGVVTPGGDLQLWLTIRSLRLRGGTAVVRTGAGLVQESDPVSEWRECCNKARRALAAVGAEVNAR